MSNLSYILNCILGIGLIGVSIYLVLYRRQIQEICRQLAFRRKEMSNKQIGIQVRTKELKVLQEELNAEFEEKHALTKEYLERDEKLKEMITNVSHDIRTPLTSIDGYFQMLCESDTEEDKARYRSIINSRLKTLNSMLEQFFTYTKLQNRSLKVALEPCDIKQILCDNLFAFYDELKAKGFEPEITLAEERLQVLADADLLNRIFQNILKNAMVHGKDNLFVVLSKKDNQVSVIIKNRSREAIVADPNQVFERFYKGDAARDGKSSGLGLCIAKELVEHMKGQIRAFTEEDYFGIEINFRILGAKAVAPGIIL